MTKISKILIANRGEIACRVARTANALGIKTVAVYSDADANSPHCKLTDEAVHIGKSPVGDSYLVIDKIIDAAKQTGADAIHPGYGFLSENADFAAACDKAGITFIGPPIKAIEVMGDKARSKHAMIEAGVPCVPGYQDDDQSDKRLVKACKDIGLPVMVKAAAGGGGRGMRLVHEEKDIASAIKLARSEAENAFGSGILIVEKAIQKPRHVEIQVFADAHGNVIHLGERDCSVQRRHQKVIEEAPCPIMTPQLREEMGAAAVEAARAVDYRGAGTVEFLLGADGAFYFLEMNTRLQVEHPVTEQVTGLDLVAMQIAVAEGAELPLQQSDVELQGHSMEVRLYAEDTVNGFLPSTGPILLWAPPSGDGIRVDDGIATGGEVSPFYDAMVAKIIATGRDREEARIKLIAALEKTVLFGFETNRDFLIDALSKPDFILGQATTAFISENYGDSGFVSSTLDHSQVAIAVAIDNTQRQSKAYDASLAVNEELLAWSNTNDLRTSAEYSVDGEIITASTSPTSHGAVITIGDETYDIGVEVLGEASAEVLSANGRSDVHFLIDAQHRVFLATPSDTRVIQNLSTQLQANADDAGDGTILAAMHGTLLEIAVSEGDKVKTGTKLAVLEAMKMQHEILAEIDGTVSKIVAKAGDQIGADELIMEIEPSDEDGA